MPHGNIYIFMSRISIGIKLSSLKNNYRPIYEYKTWKNGNSRKIVVKVQSQVYYSQGYHT